MRRGLLLAVAPACACCFVAPAFAPSRHTSRSDGGRPSFRARDAPSRSCVRLANDGDEPLFRNPLTGDGYAAQDTEMSSPFDLEGIKKGIGKGFQDLFKSKTELTAEEEAAAAAAAEAEAAEAADPNAAEDDA